MRPGDNVLNKPGRVFFNIDKELISSIPDREAKLEQGK